MYKRRFVDTAGRTRICMGYYSLNKATARKNRDYPMVIVQARDKASAATKIKQKYKIEVAAQNLRAVPVSSAEIMLYLERNGVL